MASDRAAVAASSVIAAIRFWGKRSKSLDEALELARADIEEVLRDQFADIQSTAAAERSPSD
jgi:hypothetical protein